MSRKKGFRVALRRANSSGVGKMVPATRSSKQVNNRPCPVCGAKRGQTCFVMTSARFIELKETHLGRAARTGEPLPRAYSPRHPVQNPKSKTALEPVTPRPEFVPRNLRPKAEGGRKGWSRDDWMKS